MKENIKNNLLQSCHGLTVQHNCWAPSKLATVLYPMPHIIGVTVHNAGTPQNPSAKTLTQAMQNNAETCWHFSVDENGAWQGLTLNYNGWHCSDGGTGTGNRMTIAIEICRDMYNTANSDKWEAAKRNGAKLTAILLNEYGLTINDVYTHQHWARDKKYCPHHILNEGWDKFINLVQQELNSIQGKASDTAQTALYRVQVGAYSKKSNADQMASKLKAAGFPVFVTQVNGLYKVQTGAYSKKENAVNQLNALKSKGFEGFIVLPTSEQAEAKPIETKPKEEESTMKFKYADSLYDIPKKWRDYAVDRTNVGFPNCFGLATAYISWMAGYKQPLDPDNNKVRGAGDLWKTHHPNFKQSSSPVLGALMIWTGGGENYGHVAVCIGINGNTITWLESNYSEKVGAPMSDVVARNPHGYAGLTFKGYLVHKDLSKTTIKPASNTKKTKNINGFDCIPENGTATFKYSVNVRDGSPTGKVVAVYDPGEYANYQYKYIGNGHRYIVYKSNSGSWRFVAVSGTEKQGEDPWATFK